MNYFYFGYWCIEVLVGIFYVDDVEKVVEVIIEVMREKDYVIKKDEIVVYVEGFGDFSINFLFWFWICYSGDSGFMVVCYDVVVMVKCVLEENDIFIFFFIWILDFNFKGSDNLDNMLISVSKFKYSKV